MILDEKKTSNMLTILMHKAYKASVMHAYLSPPVAREQCVLHAYYGHPRNLVVTTRVFVQQPLCNQFHPLTTRNVHQPPIK